MNNPQTNKEPAAEPPSAGAVETKLEVVILPVSDVDRAKRFYVSLGWRLDADFAAGDALRVVQLTPPGSPCSIIFGKGITAVVPGSVQGLFLVVPDLAAARSQLLGHGVEVSEVFHFPGIFQFIRAEGRLPGADPEGQSYRSFASFRDPDGNGWVLQEIKARLPGRGLSNLDVEALTQFLREAEQRHGDYSAAAPKHHWSDWYAAYIVARERGRTPEEAVEDGARHMKGVLG